MLNSDLIVLSMEAKTSNDVIEELGKLMLSQNYVKESYIEAVMEREKTLPTGLNIDNFCVAIPHTDSCHVNQSNIAIATLKEPVEFRSMVNPNEKINVKLVFLLAVKDPKAQLELLRSLMSVFQNKELLLKLQQVETKDEAIDLLNFIAV